MPVPEERVSYNQESFDRIHITSIMKYLSTHHNGINVGGDVILHSIILYRVPSSYEEHLRMTIETPAGDMMRIEGPVYSFKGCETPRDFVLRGLQYS